jgi:hypothetical protein
MDFQAEVGTWLAAHILARLPVGGRFGMANVAPLRLDYFPTAPLTRGVAVGMDCYDSALAHPIQQHSVKCDACRNVIYVKKGR